MRVRINKDLAKRKDGIDYAIFSAKVMTLDLSEYKDQRVKNSLTRINLVGKLSESHLLELAQRYSITKSEVVRRCLKWLETTPNYYSDYPNNK